MKLPQEDLTKVIEQTEDIWEDLRGQRLFITGGTGFFGCWLLETFTAANDTLDLGAEVVVLSRDAGAFVKKAPHLAGHPAVRIWRGDVTDFAFPPRRFSHVIHAATTSSAPVPNGEMVRTILRGTERVLEFALKAGVRQFLLTSSGAVYGKQPSEITNVPETFHGGPEITSQPSSVYAESKRMSELLCTVAYQETGLETKIARCFAFVGPHLPLDAHFAIGNFIRDALNRRPIHVKGDGTPYRSYLYAADLAVWLWTILLRGTPARAYNVGSPEGLTIEQLARTVGSMFRVPVTIANTPTAGASVARYVPDVSRAEQELKLTTTVSLEKAIAKTAAWYRV
jgi:dTDP-glucose 4,6-dehydratase